MFCDKHLYNCIGKLHIVTSTNEPSYTTLLDNVISFTKYCSEASHIKSLRRNGN